MREYIVRDGDTNRALVSSTGTPVDEILQALEETAQFEGVLRRHPELTPAGVAAALHFARVAVGRDVRAVPDPRPGPLQLRERPVQASGAATVVTIRSAEYDDLMYRLDLLEGIFDAERDLDEGNGIPHDEVFARLRHKFGG